MRLGRDRRILTGQARRAAVGARIGPIAPNLGSNPSAYPIQISIRHIAGPKIVTLRILHASHCRFVSAGPSGDVKEWRGARGVLPREEPAPGDDVALESFLLRPFQRAQCSVNAKKNAKKEEEGRGRGKKVFRALGAAKPRSETLLSPTLRSDSTVFEAWSSTFLVISSLLTSFRR